MAKKKRIKKKSSVKKKASRKKASKKYIAKAPIRRLMKNEGATLVAETAVELLIEKLTAIGTDLTRSAINKAKLNKKKRLTADDIINATRNLDPDPPPPPPN